jgi:hypothetical protein
MILSVAFAMTAALAAGASAPAEGAAPASAPRPCCFTHAAYVGVCSVVPAEKETCEGILAYLNNPSTTGKTYCNNTRTRGNWKNVPCPPAAPAPSAASAAGRSATAPDGATPR